MVSINGIVNKGGRPRGSGHPGKLTVTNRVKKGPNGEIWEKRRLMFRIAYNLWNEVKWKRGDKIEVLYDSEKKIGILKSGHIGHSLSSSSGKFDLIVFIPCTEDIEFPEWNNQQKELVITKTKEGEVHFKHE